MVQFLELGIMSWRVGFPYDKKIYMVLEGGYWDTYIKRKRCTKREVNVELSRGEE